MHPALRRRALLLFALTIAPLAAQTTPKSADATAREWSVTAAEIPMRDGVKLHTLIAAPRHPTVPLPFLMQRTPYGTPDQIVASLPADAARELAESGTIQVAHLFRSRWSRLRIGTRTPSIPTSSRAVHASPNSTPSIAVSTSMRCGVTPICTTPPGVVKSSALMFASGAPKRVSAAITRAAFSAVQRTQRSMPPVARGSPWAASA